MARNIDIVNVDRQALRIGDTVVPPAAADGAEATTSVDLTDGKVRRDLRTHYDRFVVVPDALSKVKWTDDFLGDAVSDEITSTAGGGAGTAAATIEAGAIGGHISMKSSSADAAITANATALTLGGLNWKAAQGGLTLETRISISDVSEAYVFIGFTDTTLSTLEAPIFLNAAAIDSDATNACGVIYDVDGTTEQWCQGGVKADTDTDPTYSGTAPVDGEWYTVRVEVSADGAVQGFIDGVAIGEPTANAVTASTALAPAILVANRSANQVTLLADYLHVEGNRA